MQQRIPFVWQPLVEPVAKRDVAAYAKRTFDSSRGVAILFGVAIGFIILCGAGFVAMLVAMLVGFLQSGSLPVAVQTGIVLAICVPIVLAVVAIIVGLRRMISGRYRGQEAAFRLDRFATANGMQFFPSITNPPLPGLVFRANESVGAVSRNVVRGMQPRVVEFGDYTYVAGSGENQYSVHWGYIAIKVDNLLPHILLDAKSNGTFGRGILDRSQRLRLEGSFNDVFTLYCPAGYERDALYLFTPDIMQRLMSDAAALDVELVDNWVFFYTNRTVSTLEPAVWEWMFSLVQAMLAKLSQWERWRDDKAGAESQVPLVAVPGEFVRQAPGVDPAGRRLGQRSSRRWWTALSIALGSVIVAMVVVNAIITALAR